MFAVLLFLTICSGCTHPQSTETVCPDKGLIVMLPGVEGSAWQLSDSVKGLRDAGIDREIKVIPWGSPPFHSIENLSNYAENQMRADRIVACISDFHRAHPDAPLTLVGYSGGGGLAVMVAEVLPVNLNLDRLILIAGAVSPDHDLTKVLARCDHGVVNFYSAADWFILGVGTQMFGTIDRKYTSSAGHVGFLDDNRQLRNVSGLTQIAWELDWIKTGHDGGHIGWLARNWARDYLAPAIVSASNATER